jgi:hypothetical protein
MGIRKVGEQNALKQMERVREKLSETERQP